MHIYSYIPAYIYIYVYHVNSSHCIQASTINIRGLRHHMDRVCRHALQDHKFLALNAAVTVCVHVYGHAKGYVQLGHVIIYIFIYISPISLAVSIYIYIYRSDTPRNLHTTMHSMVYVMQYVSHIYIWICALCHIWADICIYIYYDTYVVYIYMYIVIFHLSLSYIDVHIYIYIYMYISTNQHDYRYMRLYPICILYI